ncbi:unnamed protein product, partial [Staurois parvus]
MTKMEPTSSVRRPESGTWQSVAMETAAMGGRTGTHDTLWTWQQHEEAVRGPMADYGPGSIIGVVTGGPWIRYGALGDEAPMGR